MKVSKTYRMDKLTLALLKELADQSENDNQTDLIRKAVMLYAQEQLPHFNDVLRKNL